MEINPFFSVKQDTPHISIAPVLYIHWEWPVILQTLMYFTESTLLFISCNWSQSWLPGETRCWNRETVSKKYKLSNCEWLCGSKKAFWITPGNEAESGRVPGAWVRGWEGGAVVGLAVPASPCRSAPSTSDMIGSSCKLSPVQRSQYIPDDEYDADLLEEKYISEEKNNYFSKQDNEAEPTLHGHKIEQNFWTMALVSNKSPTWRSFCRVSLDVSGPTYFQRYIKLKNYAFTPWFLLKGTDTLLCHSLQFSC